MNKNKRIFFGIVGGALYMLGFIVDDTDILVQLITTVLMLKHAYQPLCLSSNIQLSNSLYSSINGSVYSCLSIAEGTYEKNNKS